MTDIYEPETIEIDLRAELDATAHVFAINAQGKGIERTRILTRGHHGPWGFNYCR